MEKNKINKTEEEWKKELTPEQYKVLRKKGTEKAFSGIYHDIKDKGMYKCAACGNVIFSSDTKFDSGTGWPSFYDAEEGSIEMRDDSGFFMHRTEVVCSKCESHLGHVFDDGPDPTGKRYCINSVALNLDKDKGVK